jgi:hypothetical protein
MKRIGNAESNKQFNPRNVKVHMPIDVDEVDSAMERFIRQKYQDRVFSNESQPGTRHNTGSTSSVEDKPPPLPPKPGKRFGFGLQKSSNASRNDTPPTSPGIGDFGQGDSPPRVNKPSRVFGSNITTSGDGLDSKLASLREMGFPDERRNSTVLKGLNGNLDRTVEALIRLGEQNSVKSGGNTPTPPAKPGMNGITFGNSSSAQTATSSADPFEALDTVAPLPPQQRQNAPVQNQQMAYGAPSNSYNPFLSQQQTLPQQTYPQQQQQQFSQSTNPFDQQQQNLEQSFQGLQLANQPPPQQLFPNRTGGYAPPQPQYSSTNPFQQSFTPPPMPQIPQQYASFYQPQQTQYQPMVSSTSAGNPFLKSSRSQMFSPATRSANPFDQLQAQAQPPPQPQPQPQPLQQQASNPFMMQNATLASQQSVNPWQQSQQQNANPWQQNQQYNAQYSQQQNYQPTQGAFDNNSIMALYNYPQLAPQRSLPAQSAPVPAPAPMSTSAAPASGNSNNPFAASQMSVQAQTARHASHESVDFAGLMGGRHSPDAFSGLSASFRR